LARSREGDDFGIYLGELDRVTPPGRRLVTTNAGAAYVPFPSAREGHLLFLREGTLMAQPFDASEFKLKGDRSPVVEHIGGTETSGSPRFSVSETGVLVYRASGSGLTTRLTWFDRTGKEIGSVGAADEFSHPRLSPDEKRIAFELPDSKSGGPTLWTLDLS